VAHFCFIFLIKKTNTMKKLKLNLVLIALVLGVTGAVAFKPAYHKAKTGDSYYWFRVSDGSYDAFTDPGTEADNTGCKGNNDPCENGYISSQLTNPLVPADGVKSGEDPMSTIYIAD
jgi:hypothetical protein